MIMICFSLPTASNMTRHQVSSLTTSESVQKTADNSGESGKFSIIHFYF